MAIQIDSSLNLKSGVIVESSYLRVDYFVNQYENEIDYNIYPYLNRDIYLEDKLNNVNRKNNVLAIPYFVTSQSMEYDSSVSGYDLLQIVSDDAFTYVTTDEIYKEVIYDPSTGEPIIDPSTGQPETKDVVIREKFALPQDVSIIDID